MSAIPLRFKQMFILNKDSIKVTPMKNLCAQFTWGYNFDYMVWSSMVKLYAQFTWDAHHVTIGCFGYSLKRKRYKPLGFFGRNKPLDWKN